MSNNINKTATQSFGIGFFQSQGSLGAANNFQTGAQSINMYYAANITGATPTATAEMNINGGAQLLPAQNVDICVSDDTQYADIILGNDNNQLAITVKRGGQGSCP